jgi:hypothetical protein
MSQVIRVICYCSIVLSTCNVSSVLPASAENTLVANPIGLSLGYCMRSEGRSVALAKDGSNQLGHVRLGQIAPGLSVFDLQIDAWLGLLRIEQGGKFVYGAAPLTDGVDKSTRASQVYAVFTQTPLANAPPPQITQQAPALVAGALTHGFLGDAGPVRTFALPGFALPNLIYSNQTSWLTGDLRLVCSSAN